MRIFGDGLSISPEFIVHRLRLSGGGTDRLQGRAEARKEKRVMNSSSQHFSAKLSLLARICASVMLGGMLMVNSLVAMEPSKAREERAKARAKYHEEQAKAGAKAVEEGSKAQAKWIEERAKGRPKWIEEREKARAKAIEERGKAEAKWIEESGKARAKSP
jgi:ketol-acid reductoisomerase